MVAHKSTLLVLKTTEGHVLGGFASAYSRDENGFGKQHAYFGFGTCFLFSTYSRNADTKKAFSYYRWTGVSLQLRILCI